MELEVRRADITTVAVDAVVNAANETLAPGGGVCGAIHDAAGPGLAEECSTLGPCPTGEAVATGAYRLPARWVVHAVGPVWRGGDAGETELLRSAYRRSVEVADELGARSIAFPAISTGIFGFPLERATAIAVATLRSLSPGSVGRCVLVAFDDRTESVLRSAVAAG